MSNSYLYTVGREVDKDNRASAFPSCQIKSLNHLNVTRLQNHGVKHRKNRGTIFFTLDYMDN